MVGKADVLRPEAVVLGSRERVAEVDEETLLTREPDRGDRILDAPLAEDLHRACADRTPLGEERGGRVPLHQQAVDPEATKTNRGTQSHGSATYDEDRYRDFCHINRSWRPREAAE